MLIEIDFNSDEAIYLQLRNQIILGIATNTYREGDALPSVRALADEIGINMHTVNKAYSLLRQEGYVKVDRRKGAVIAIDETREEHLSQIREVLAPIVLEAVCRNVSKEELHKMLDEIYDKYRL
ncbi:MAG: GntR family transcriptional regulator [Lachnospiraceae bacterium]|nr:GntR family transcriptional regulator [Lachnospiraceae bacterium]MBR1651609.1 GntR family transcriptional regulator [Lachnospiraceae bacterium]